MRSITFLVSVFLLLLLSACQRQNTVCPPDSITYFNNSTVPTALESTETGPIVTPALVEIKGKMTEVDQVVRGPVCNTTWSGTIYVACDIQIAKWVESPRFFQACDLTIEPNTTIYVAAHNDTAYYKGCSCHTGELASQ